MFRTKISVRYAETDRMGIVHHSRYFPWFEVGRTEFFKSGGMTYDQVEKEGVWLPLVDCYAKFIEGARYGDDVWIEVELAKLGVAKCIFCYRLIRDSDQKELATGYTTHGFTTPGLKPLNLKREYPHIYKIMEKLRGEEA